MGADPSGKKKVKLEQYLDSYKFTATSRIRKKGNRIYLPEVFCHNGHNLMVSKIRFEGFPAINILARIGGEGGPTEDFYLSPIVNDPHKEGPDLPDGTRLQLLCPVCKEELPKLVPCSCRVGAFRRAIYLTPDIREMAAVGLCEIYGCPQSFVSDEGELIYEVIVEKKKD